MDTLAPRAAPRVAWLLGLALVPLFLNSACSGCSGSHPLGAKDAAADVDAPSEPASLDVAADVPANEVARPPDGAADVSSPPDAIDAPDAPDGHDARLLTDARTDANAAYLDAVTSFCDEKARRTCAWRTRCNQAFASDEDCRPVERASCEASLAAWQAGAANEGRIAFDQTQAAACLAVFDNPDCEVATDQPCVPTAGRVPDGMPCIYANECAGGTCGRTTTACTGTCRSPGKVGEPCWVDGWPPCDDAVAWCEYPSHVCRAKKAIGDACLAAGECGPGDFCESPMGNRCGDFAGDSTNCHCRALLALGASCSNDVSCLPDLICFAGVCRGPGAKGQACDTQYIPACVDDLACVPRATGDTKGVCGERVASGAPCSAGECARGLRCDYPPGGNAASGRCRPLHPLGSPCATVEDCVVGSTCLGQPMKCTAIPKLGESCEGGGGCWGGGGVTCLSDGTNATCGFVPKLGEPCDRTCAEGAYCLAGTCVAQKVGADPCADSHECRGGMCLTDPIPADCHTASCVTKHCTPYCTYANFAGP